MGVMVTEDVTDCAVAIRRKCDMVAVTEDAAEERGSTSTFMPDVVKCYARKLWLSHFVLLIHVCGFAHYCAV
jgi:hypothetical protein